MTCLGDRNDATFYSASYPSGELELYPFMEPLPDSWCVIEWPGHAVISPSDLQAALIHEPVASATPQTPHIDGYNHPSYAGGYWPTVQAEPHHIWGYDIFSTAPADSGTSTGAPTPRDVPFNYWGGNEGQPSAETSYEGAQLRHPNTRRQMRTKPIPTRQFRTHTTPHAPANEHGNAEAGPSTRVPQPTPYVDPPTPQPSEGTPEATVDAEYQTSTEEHGVPTQREVRTPHDDGRSREYYKRRQGNAVELRALVKCYTGSDKTPSLIEALKVAVNVIPKIRESEYSEPRLLSGYETHTDPSKTVATCRTKSTDNKLKRKDKERQLFEELSKYYPLKEGRRAWGRPELSSLVRRDLRTFFECQSAGDELS